MFYGNLSKFGKRSSSVKSLNSRGLSLYMVRSQNVIYFFREGHFMLFDKIPVSTIKLPQWQFQAFFDVSWFEKLIWKSRRLQNKTSRREGSQGISYKLQNKRRHSRGEVEILLTRKGKLGCGNWNRHVSHKWKCEDDRPSRSTKVNPWKKQNVLLSVVSLISSLTGYICPR